MSLPIVVVIIAVTSGVPAFVLTREPWLAVGLAPLIFAVCATVAGMVATVLQVSMLGPFLAIVVGANALALRPVLARRLRLALPRAQLAAGAVVTGVAVYCLLPLKAPLIGGDTRTHWFGPARWFFGGGGVMWDAIVNPASGHRDYPPLMAATIAAVWRLLGHIDLRAGQVVISLCNFGAIVLVGVAIPRLFPRLVVIATAGGCALVLAAYGFAGQFANDGYADLLWSACVTAGVLYLLLAPPGQVNTMVGTIALVVAGTAKNEGTVVALAVIALACWQRRHRPREAYPLFAALPIVLMWPIFVRLRGVDGDLRGADVVAFLRGESRIWRRLEPTLRAMSDQSISIVIAALVCTALGLAVARRFRARAGVGSTGWTWATAGVTFLAVAAAYVIASDSLAAHLDSSVDRTAIALRLLLLTETVIWALCGLETLARRRPVPRPPEDLRVESDT